MTYNIHPLFVHFPIAFLFLYSIIKIVPFKKWLPNVSWKHIERVFLLVGFLGALAAIITGSIAKNLIHPNEQLVAAHATFALLTALIYGLLLLGEIISFFKARENFLCDGLISKLLALSGLMSISITGMLGGVMVYGLSADPLAGVVLKLLGINL